MPSPTMAELPPLVKEKRWDKGIVQSSGGEGKMQRTTTTKTKTSTTSTMTTSATTTKTITMMTTTTSSQHWSRRGEETKASCRREERRGEDAKAWWIYRGETSWRRKDLMHLMHSHQGRCPQVTWSMVSGQFCNKQINQWICWGKTSRRYREVMRTHVILWLTKRDVLYRSCWLQVTCSTLHSTIT